VGTLLPNLPGGRVRIHFVHEHELHGVVFAVALAGEVELVEIDSIENKRSHDLDGKDGHYKIPQETTKKLTRIHPQIS
jgi:hypothetical protein